MSAKRLLLVCYFYPPLAGGGVHRVLSFTQYLPALGWECTVVCAGERDYWVTDPSLAARIPAGTEVIRVPGGSALSTLLRFGRGGGGGGKRSGATFAGLRRASDWWLLPDSYAGWAKRARVAVEQRVRQGGVDAVLSSSPPDSAHLAAARVAAAQHVPWIVDFRDPWIGLYFRDPPTAWHWRRQAALERAVIEGADVVLTASRSHAESLGAASGARARRVVHLPNGFEPASGPAEPAGVVADDGTFRLVFTGTLSLMPEVETLLEALHEVFGRLGEARRRVRVDLVGPYDAGYEDRAIALGMTGIVRFLGPRSHAETRALQRRADVLLLWKPRGAGYRTMVPGKLYEYLDAGRPILALLEPGEEAAELVQRAGGQVLAPGDRAALARELETRYTAWKAGTRVPDARPVWLEDYTRASLAARLARELDHATGRNV